MTIRQFNLMRMIEDNGLGIEDALRLNQVTFGSLCLHKWVQYSTAKKQFELSHDGADALDNCKNPNLFRLRESRSFSMRVFLPVRTRRMNNVEPPKPRKSEIAIVERKQA